MPFVDAADAISRFELGAKAVELSGHDRYSLGTASTDCPGGRRSNHRPVTDADLLAFAHDVLAAS
jgi:hypothetical protein